jgi:hypothetical protein
MREQRVVRTLQETAEREVPGSIDLWPAIRARLRPQRHRSPWARLVPTTHLGWAFLALILLLAVSTMAYAVVPVVNRIFQQEVGLSHVERAGLSQEIVLSQTIDGVTVTLERGYADVNRIVLGYTIHSADGRRYDAYSMRLSDANGAVFLPTVGMGVTGQSDVMETSLPPGEGDFVFSFDTTDLQGMPSTLDLHLEIELKEPVLPPNEPALPSTQEKPPALPALTMAEATAVREGALVGPFTFDFGLPLSPGHTVEVQQTVEAAGIALELKRVVVTPSETRALLCIESPGHEWEHWAIVATLGTKAGQAENAWSANPEEGCALHGFLPPLYGREGDWALTVTELIEFADEPSGEQTRLSGPWVFHFRVP